MASRKNASSDVQVNASHIAGIAKSLDVLVDGMTALHDSVRATTADQSVINTQVAAVEQQVRDLLVTMTSEKGVLPRLAVLEAQVKALEGRGQEDRQDAKDKGKDSEQRGYNNRALVVAVLALVVSVLFGALPYCAALSARPSAAAPNGP